MYGMSGYYQFIYKKLSPLVLTKRREWFLLSPPPVRQQSVIMALLLTEPLDLMPWPIMDCHDFLLARILRYPCRYAHISISK